MSIPQHLANIAEDREAYAPYNFVPLPDQVVPAEMPLPAHNIYHPDRYTGRLECTLMTSSPMYVRCGSKIEEYATHSNTPFHELNDEQKRARAQFFHLDDPDIPLIPGSSLRGMLRALVEIVSYGKMDRLIDRQLFYRSVADQNYRDFFVETVTPAPHGKTPTYQTLIKTGFLHRNGNQYVIKECDHARIDHHALNLRRIAAIPRINDQQLMIGSAGANRKPNWNYQQRTIYVDVDPTAVDYLFPKRTRPDGSIIHNDLYLRFRGVRNASFANGAIPTAQEGTLVITGHMQNKHLEFVFLHNHVATHDIAPELIKRFEDEDQITPWQEDAFPKDRPTPLARRANGMLRDGEPVFFLLNSAGSVQFFGRAQLFRLPYGNSPLDFVPQDNRDMNMIDIAEAIFGFVRPVKQNKMDVPQVVAGRISVSDGRFLTAKDGVWFTNDPITPKILGSPKPTTYQHYLVQPSSHQRSLRRYDSPPNQTTIRGHKLYWHKGRIPSDTIHETDEQKIASAPKQYTRMRPVKEGVSFSFDIRFENLSEVELGALLWVLRLASDKKYRLKLGMGKPLGMGAVAIEHKVYCIDRLARYSAFFSSDGFATAESELDASSTDKYIDTFEQHVRKHGGNDLQTYTKLDATPRLKHLLALLSWPGPDPLVSRYMEIERPAQHPDGVRPGRKNNGKVNEYSNRLVLPTPTQVIQDHPSPVVSDHKPAPPIPPTPDALPPGVRITGQRGKQVERFEFQGRTIKGVRIIPNPGQMSAPPKGELICFVEDQQRGSGFGGIIVAIDNTNPKQMLVLLKPTKKE